MGVRDMIRRKRADRENQGDDFIEDDFIVPAEKFQQPKEVKQDVADNQTQ